MKKEVAKAPQSTPLTKATAAMAFALVLVGMLFFDSITNWAGRKYYQRLIPAELTENKIIESLGEPAKRCDAGPQCEEYLDAFVFQKDRPPHVAFFAYTDHYPLLPILVFFQDSRGQVIDYDFGKN